ncbi:MAG: rhodanese-like domain-containing protein, partial [Flavobacteriales bacterium]
MIKKLLGIGAAVDLRSEVNQGAVIVDVRTEMEYRSGHIKGSLNIPLQN